MIGDRPVETRIVGVRPGEKIHESLVSGEESFRTFERGSYYVIQPILPEIREGEPDGPRREGEYTSDEEVASREAVAELLIRRRLRVEDGLELEGEFLR